MGERAVELVIFDCDGVLVDSERLANRVLAALVTDVGLPTSFEECVSRYMGRSMPSCVALIEQQLGRPLPPDFESRYYERVFAAFDQELGPVPGVVEALDALDAAGMPSCVASSGPHERIRRALGLTGLLERFEGRLFSAAEVVHGKPAPDLFLHAARQLDVAPDRCVVVEDSPAGVVAGRAAGMRVLGYADLTPADRLASAGATVFSSMIELPELVRSDSPGGVKR